MMKITKETKQLQRKKEISVIINNIHTPHTHTQK